MNQQIIQKLQSETWTDDERKILELFWEPSFRENWLYVSKEMVCDYFGYADTETWNQDFYDQIIKKWLDDSSDYRIVSRDDPAVITYLDALKKVNGGKLVKLKNHIYFAVTISAFQKICIAVNTQKSIDTFFRFSKIHNLACNYIMELVDTLHPNPHTR